MKRKIVTLVLLFPVLVVSAQIPIDSLVAFYPFNGNANDKSGNENNGNVIGATLTTDRYDNADQAYSFDGESNYIRVYDSDNLDDSNELSISCWFNTKNLGGDYHHDFVPIISKWFSWTHPDSCSYLIYLDGSNINYHINDGISRDTLQANINFNIDEWVHLVCLFDSTYFKIYVNGILQINKLSSISKINNSLADLKIGNWYKDYNSKYSTFEGVIDEIRIYKKALSEAEIHSLFNEPNTSIELKYNKPDILVYPNPTVDILTIEAKGINQYYVGIVNLLGQEVFYDDYKESINQIDLSKYNPGIYAITIKSDDFISTKKIIKQ
jgi:hypothetical protein